MLSAFLIQEILLRPELRCATISITKRKGDSMLITVDFNSEEAIYMQLRNQIIMGIATSVIREGDSLPSVRQLADTGGSQYAHSE